MLALALMNSRMEREAAREMQRLGRGVWGLRLVAAAAPFTGALGTCFGILGSFRGIVGEKSQLLAALAYYLSEAILPVAAGLLIGIVARSFYVYLSSRMEEFRAEFELHGL